MNTLAQQFKVGLYMATQSFTMLWYQKKLLIYLGLLALINIGFKLIVTNVSSGTPFFSLFKIIHHHIAALPLWIIPFETAVGLLFANSLTIFFTIALLHHIADIMQNKKSSIRESFIHTSTKINIILAWAILSSILEGLTNYFIENGYVREFALIEYLILAFFIIMWLLATFFVLPLIALRKQSLISTIKSSAEICRNMILLVMGGECWFGLMILLVATPFLFIWLLSNQPALNPIFPALGLVSAEILVKCWIATTHNIFKMVVLQSHKPLEEFKVHSI